MTEKNLTENRGRLLIVDDTEMIRKSMARQLARVAYTVHTADNGANALAALRKDYIDLVIIDYRMPEMDGLELFDKIKNDFPNMPVIMMTGEGSVDLALKFMKSGGTNFLVKPLNFERLNADIQQALQTVKLRQEIETLKKEHVKLLNLLETIKSQSHQAETKIRLIQSAAEGLTGPHSDKGYKIGVAVKQIERNITTIAEMIASLKKDE